jgi:flagellar biosynthesis protein FliR
MDHLPFTVDTVELFLLMLVRVTAIMALFPIFGSYTIPAQAKIGLALVLTVLLFSSTVGLRPIAVPGHFSGAMLIFVLVKEVLVGLTIGFTSVFLFSAVHFAARLVDTEMGFGMVDLIDPMSEEPITVMGQLWIIVFTIFLLLINGHYFFLLAIQKSFELIPVLGADIQTGRLAAHFADMVGTVFVLALKMSAPVYVALILTEMALGVVARTVPQINIFFVGLPMKIIIGIGTAIVVFPMLATLFKNMFEGIVKDIWSVLYMMA